MALFNYATKEITLKIVYYGPGLSGKTTNLQYLHASVLQPESTGKLLSLATESDRTLFFDFLPVELGKIRDFTIRFQLYTVPGQVRYNATRKVVLKGADAVIFVADSQTEMREQNIESFDNMRENLVSNNINPDDIPVVVQYNKRDLKNISSIAELNEYLNPYQYPVIEASAISGAGVEESFKLITRLMLKYISKKHKIEIQQPAQERDALHAAPTAPEPEPNRPPVAEKKPAVREAPEDIRQPEVLSVEEAIEIFPQAGEETVEVAEAYLDETPENVFELPDAEEIPPPPPPYIPLSETEPAPERMQEPELPPAHKIEIAPEPEQAWPPETRLEPAPEPEQVPQPEPKFERARDSWSRSLPQPEPQPERIPEPEQMLPPEPMGMRDDHQAVASMSQEAVAALTDEMRQVRESLSELQKIGTVIEELAQSNGILTDLKNAVYVLSKEVKELKEIHRAQEETNGLLRSIASIFEGLKAGKGWFRF